MKFPKLPESTMFAEKRQHRKGRLVTVCRVLTLHNLDYDFAGHLTMRDPEFPELYRTNSMATHSSQTKFSNLTLTNYSGKVIEGSCVLNRASFVLHAAVYEANSDIVAMCHAYIVYGTTFTALGRSLDPITWDAAVFFEDHVVTEDEAGAVTVGERAGTSICDRLENVKATIHQNHGLLTVSRHDIEATASWLIVLERCYQQQLLIEAAEAKPVTVLGYSSHYSREHVGSECIGRLHFRPIYEQLMQTNPDMLDWYRNATYQ